MQNTLIGGECRAQWWVLSQSILEILSSLPEEWGKKCAKLV